MNKIIGTILVCIAALMIMVVNEPLKDRIRILVYWTIMASAAAFGIYLILI